jgi:hypothetical protein
MDKAFSNIPAKLTKSMVYKCTSIIEQAESLCLSTAWYKNFWLCYLEK